MTTLNVSRCVSSIEHLSITNGGLSQPVPAALTPAAGQRKRRGVSILGEVLMKHRLLGTVGVLTAVLAGSAGCQHEKLRLDYGSSGVPVPGAWAGVALRTIDARPPDRGGGQGARVGNLRGPYGAAAGMSDENGDVVLRTVWEATADALGRTGVAAGPGPAPKTLIAWIVDYWMDGYIGIKCTIAIRYQLVDSSSLPRWGAEVRGESGALDRAGLTWFGPHPTGRNSEKLTRETVLRALDDLTMEAQQAFISPAFRQALAM
jgi:hypothetical protein